MGAEESAQANTLVGGQNLTSIAHGDEQRVAAASAVGGDDDAAPAAAKRRGQGSQDVRRDAGLVAKHDERRLESDEAGLSGQGLADVAGAGDQQPGPGRERLAHAYQEAVGLAVGVAGAALEEGNEELAVGAYRALAAPATAAAFAPSSSARTKSSGIAPWLSVPAVFDVLPRRACAAALQ